MPSRNNGWSSTARIGIRLGLLLMILARALAVKPKPCASGKGFIGNGPWNAKIHLSACTGFTPHFQLPSDVLGAFTHSRQAPVPGASAVLKELWSNALSVVPEAQTKQRFTICDLRFYVTRLCMAEGISQRLPRNAVYLVAENRTHNLWGAFHEHAKGHRIPVACCNLFFQVSHHHIYRLRQILTNHRAATSFLDATS